jgi:hypothetical protein
VKSISIQAQHLVKPIVKACRERAISRLGGDDCELTSTALGTADSRGPKRTRARRRLRCGLGVTFTDGDASRLSRVRAVPAHGLRERQQ